MAPVAPSPAKEGAKRQPPVAHSPANTRASKEKATRLLEEREQREQDGLEEHQLMLERVQQEQQDLLASAGALSGSVPPAVFGQTDRFRHDPLEGGPGQKLASDTARPPPLIQAGSSGRKRTSPSINDSRTASRAHT
jgi:hypothetical protein